MANLFPINFLLLKSFLNTLVAKSRACTKILFLFLFYFYASLSFAKNIYIQKNERKLEVTNQNFLEEEIILNRYANNDQVLDFIDKMVVNHNFDHSSLRRLFDEVSYSSTAVELFSSKSPIAVKNWHLHRSRIINENLINSGLIFYKDNRYSIEQASLNFDIPRAIILGIIGVETAFGRNMGNFRVLDVLTTLSFDYPEITNHLERKAFFKKNLKDFLIFCRMANIDPKSVLGSYAGAIGIPQFMPTSILKYAISGSGKAVPDLIQTSSDAIYSVANFLKKNGWRSGEPVAWRIAKDKGNQELAEAGLNVCRPRQCSLQRFLSAGMSFEYDFFNQLSEKNIIEKMLSSRVTIIDLQTPQKEVEYMIGFTNFNVLLRYNHSYFYAASVLELAKEIEKEIAKGI